jgi:hypothetical protein
LPQRLKIQGGLEPRNQVHRADRTQSLQLCQGLILRCKRSGTSCISSFVLATQNHQAPVDPYSCQQWNDDAADHARVELGRTPIRIIRSDRPHFRSHSSGQALRLGVLFNQGPPAPSTTHRSVRLLGACSEARLLSEARHCCSQWGSSLAATRFLHKSWTSWQTQAIRGLRELLSNEVR